MFLSKLAVTSGISWQCPACLFSVLPSFDIYDETPAISSAEAGDKLFTDGTSPVDLLESVVTGV